ncbi:hypothetical protein V8C34DRAFT_319816 [Trichoderma compactum]
MSRYSILDDFAVMLKAVSHFVLRAPPAETSDGQLPITTGPAGTETAPAGTETTSTGTETDVASTDPCGTEIAPAGTETNVTSIVPAEIETIIVYSTPPAETSDGSSPYHRRCWRGHHWLSSV